MTRGPLGETLRVFRRFDYVLLAATIPVIDDTILTLNKTARSRGPLRPAVSALPPQLAIKPPKPETDYGSKNGDDAAQHHKRNESQHDGGPDHEGTDENDEDIGNRVAGRQTASAR